MPVCRHRRGCRKVLSCTVMKLRRVEEKRGAAEQEIVAAHVAYSPQGRRTNHTLVFSHGNAVDLGQMLPFYRWVYFLARTDVSLKNATLAGEKPVISIASWRRPLDSQTSSICVIYIADIFSCLLPSAEF